MQDQAAGDVKPRQAGRPAEGMAGLAKGLAVLEIFGSGRQAVTITEAAEQAALSRAAARRCLLTLTELGYLSYDGKYFRPAPRLLRLGRAYSGTSSLPELAQPYLTAARDALSESVSLAILAGDESMFVARAEAARIVTTGVRVGVSLPAYLTATGHVLLAGLDDQALDSYLGRCRPERRTPRTPVTRAEIRRRVERARETGVAYTDEELEPGLRSLAVPVADRSGSVRAAMSASASAARVPLDVMLEQFAPVLQAKARALGAVL
jgi:IclR family transcriptional regulator, pca regulon regulatory protein